jgi:hypothetical protein
VGCTPRVNDRKPYIAIGRNILGGIDFIPHRKCGAWVAENSFDLTQIPGDNVCQPTWWSGPMERFVRRENIKHYKELLKTLKDEAERQQILKLLAEERQKQKEAGDKIEE